jgi:hypothetical protein
MFLDLDHYRSVNGQLGHSAGDVVLKAVLLGRFPTWFISRWRTTRAMAPGVDAARWMEGCGSWTGFVLITDLGIVE